MITVLFCCFSSLIAQESSPKKAKIFQAWIELNNNSAIAKGVLYEADRDGMATFSVPSKMQS